MEAVLIFPHQLFANHPAVTDSRRVYLVEETLFFNQYHFHQKKILLHRASMRCYADMLKDKKIPITYIDAQSELSDVRKLIQHLHVEQITSIHFADVADNWLERRITETCIKYDIKVIIHATPQFLNTMAEANAYFDKTNTYFQTAFYIQQRKDSKILLTPNGGPEGGQWSYDADNRLKFPKNEKPPIVNFQEENNYIKEAHAYVKKYYSKNYGNGDQFFYPIDHTSAEVWLHDFFETRFAGFGSYEDAIVEKEHFLHHSVISPLLNTGLLTPQQVIEGALKSSAEYNVPLNSTEGFIRQVMGWREYIRIVYEREGSRQRKKNYWGFERKIPEAFWKGTTGIVPVDSVINKVLDIGYCHHIERLMVMGNFMLLCEFDPDDVYRWFMELFIDAYDWVMVPNVYGMTQFSDGGVMMTKPYISGSNYLLKMSNYKKGEWTEIWDGLFWRFMHVHRDFFLQNSRLGMLIKTFDKMPEAKKNNHIDVAEKYLATLRFASPYL